MKLDNSFMDFLHSIFFSILKTDFYILTPPDYDISLLDRGFRNGLTNSDSHYRGIRIMLEKMEPKTFYLVQDKYFMNYISFLPFSDSNEIIAVGPYLLSPCDEELFTDLIINTSITQSQLSQLRGFYYNLPVLSNNLVIISALNNVISFINPDSTSFQILDVNKKTQQSIPEIFDLSNDLEYKVRSVEKRYQLENKVLDFIAIGDSDKALQVYRKFVSGNIPSRYKDGLRDLKNHAYTANTLFRKAAEGAAVHPFYLDQLSYEIAQQIELKTTKDQLTYLLENAIRKYCLLVQNNSLKEYSAIIQSALNYINLNLSMPLSLKEVSAQLNISSSYLAHLFKKELNTSLTDYVTEKRIKQTLKLLSTTKLSIQTICSYVGIDDSNYFTKIFKKKIGYTPSEYRKMLTAGSSN